MKILRKEHLCPICGKYKFKTDGSFDICVVCGWEDDSFQLQNPEETGANEFSLNEYKEKYKAGWRPEWLENYHGDMKMKVKFLGESDPLYFINGKVYNVIGEEKGMHRIIDETGEDYLYILDENFEIIE